MDNNAFFYLIILSKIGGVNLKTLKLAGKYKKFSKMCACRVTET